MLTIEESYFEGEERCGFFVDEELKRAWAAQMEMFEDIKAVCERHNIKFYADWGTLLGAVRHQGFVPWDDDIDLCMFRKDLMEFLKVAPTELPENYNILSIHTNEEYRDVMTRVINDTNINWSAEHLEKYHGCPWVCGIDIFTLDYIPKNRDELNMLYQITIAVDQTLALIWHSEFDDMKEQAVKEIEKACGVKFDWSKPLDRQLLQFIDRLYTMYKAKDCRQVGVISVLARHAHMHPVSKNAYASVEMRPFEGLIEMPVPVGYDEILTNKYNSRYMEYDVFHPHDFPFFVGQKEQLKQTLEAHPELQDEIARFLA